MAWRGTNGGNPITGQKPIVNMPTTTKGIKPTPGKPKSSLSTLR
jgi:hypothetical protein